MATKDKTNGMVPEELKEHIEHFMEHEDATTAAAYTAIAVAIYYEYTSHGISAKQAAIGTAGLIGALITTKGSNAQIFVIVPILGTLGFDSIMWIKELIMTYLHGTVEAGQDWIKDMIKTDIDNGNVDHNMWIAWLQQMHDSGDTKGAAKTCKMQYDTFKDGTTNPVADWCRLNGYETRG